MKVNPQHFIALVSALTGVSIKVVGEAETTASYLSQFQALADPSSNGDGTYVLVDAFTVLSQNIPPDQAAATILAGKLDGFSPNPNWPLSAMARSLMKFVLLGLWLDPNNTSKDYEGEIPTAVAYSESLVWLIAQAHAVGASKMAYGHWAGPPPSLKDMIG